MAAQRARLLKKTLLRWVQDGPPNGKIIQAFQKVEGNRDIYIAEGSVRILAERFVDAATGTSAKCQILIGRRYSSATPLAYLPLAKAEVLLEIHRQTVIRKAMETMKAGTYRYPPLIRDSINRQTFVLNECVQTLWNLRKPEGNEQISQR
jgi:hypothetical protein